MAVRPASTDRPGEWATAELSLTVQFARPAQTAASQAGLGLDVEALAAGRGQSLLLTYGDPADPKRILVDCGPPATYSNLSARLSEIPSEQRRIELLVLTHVDADRIGGALQLLQDTDLGISFDELWFNGLNQMVAAAREPL